METAESKRLPINQSFAAIKPMQLPIIIAQIANHDSPLEPAWRASEMAFVLAEAERAHLACIGGQFQFRGPFGIAEMYWLNADANPRNLSETWEQYVRRALTEVSAGIETIMVETDFLAEADKWPSIKKLHLETGIHPLDHLFFVAYFEFPSETT